MVSLLEMNEREAKPMIQGTGQVLKAYHLPFYFNYGIGAASFLFAFPIL